MENRKVVGFSIFAVLLTGILAIIAVLIAFPVEYSDDPEEIVFERPVWGYKCENQKCLKTIVTADNLNSLLGFEACRILCGDDIGTLWPRPSGKIKHDTKLVQIDLNSMQWNIKYTGEIAKLLNESLRMPRRQSVKEGGKSNVFEVILETENLALKIDTQEDYKLTIKEQKDALVTKIEASTFYGARHALETFSQLIVFDDLRNEFHIPSDIEINDAPKFKHRGLSFDTSRNFYSKDVIKKTIDGLAMVKMNTFHWHVTDSESFPLVLKSNPDLAKYGAYSKQKTYTADDVKEIVQYAKSKGVRVIPEFDSPAHVAEGWQLTDFLICYNIQPWKEFCANPPCGQFNPSKDKLYDVLQNLYQDYVDMFGDFDMFHMGGDEVSIKCWNTSEELQTWMIGKGWNLEEEDFMKLWGYHQDNSLERFDKVTKSKIPIIVWTSSLTEEPYLTKYLDKDRYIIQIWTKGNDTRVKTLLEKGYKLIISNYDALYLDCGFSSPVTDGLNWCSPYIGWQKFYNNRIEDIAGEYINQVLGAEAALWSEQIDGQNLDSRLWPRVSAIAERLWSDPETDWREADSRMLMNRKRLVENGISADRLQPEWCLQNEGECPIRKRG